MEKKYRVVGNTGHWAVAEDGAEPVGDYATREGALEEPPSSSARTHWRIMVRSNSAKARARGRIRPRLYGTSVRGAIDRSMSGGSPL